jgi:glutaredoxin
MNNELVMYSRTTGCPFITIARHVLEDYAIPYREIFIDRDPEARQRVLRWTGFLSVPTLVVTPAGQDIPAQEPIPLVPGSSPRGINRGMMITEAGIEQLIAWLAQHGFIEHENAYMGRKQS